VPHFVGLHAIQVLAIVAVGLRRWRRAEAARVEIVTVAAASYATLFVLLLWEALRGSSVIAPDATSLAALAIWVGITALALSWAILHRRNAPPSDPDRILV
jgi:hypothetical protein